MKILLSIFSIIALLTACSSPSVPSGNPSTEDLIKSGINDYMASESTDEDTEQTYCANQLFDYNEKYAYAWVLCESFVEKEGEWSTNSGSSMPIRFSISTQDNFQNFEIVGHDEPKDGSLYGPSIKELFPKELQSKATSGPEQLNELMKEIRKNLTFNGPLGYTLLDFVKVSRKKNWAFPVFVQSSNINCSEKGSDYESLGEEYLFMSDIEEIKSQGADPENFAWRVAVLPNTFKKTRADIESDLANCSSAWAPLEVTENNIALEQACEGLTPGCGEARSTVLPTLQLIE